MASIGRVASLLFVALTIPALATTTIRCDSHIIDQGMPADEVRQHCGEPTAIEEGGRVWVYDFGSGQLLKVIKFVQGKVEFIDERPRD
jgi:hypothetical protein